MKRILFIITTLFVCSCSVDNSVYMMSYFVGNGEDGLHLCYSEDGLKWTALNDGNSYLKPHVGKNSLMRDPFILHDKNGTFHLVWTTGWNDKGIGYASSKDLINWSEQIYIPVMEHEPTAKNCWAPEMCYDKENDLYYIFWATTIPDRHSEVAESESEKGYNHRMYYTTTRDFKNFAPAELFFNSDFSAIDASVVRDGERYVMFIKNENPNPAEKNIRIVTTEILPDFPAGDVSAPITGDYWAEGPAPLKVGDYWYLYFDKYSLGSYGALRSEDMVDWEDVSENLVVPEGIRHSAAFSVSRKELDVLIGDKSELK